MFDVKNVVWRPFSIIVSLAFAAVCVAHAAEPLSIELIADHVYDDNLFRLPGNVDPLGTQQPHDVINSLGAHLNWDVPLSLQSVNGNVGFTANRFQHNHQLDNNSLNLALGWEGELTKEWKGNAKLRRDQALASFADFQDGQRNTITQDYAAADLSRQISSYWLMFGHVEYGTSAHSLASQQYNDRHTWSVRLGTSGQSSAGSEMKLFISSRTVDFVNLTWSPEAVQDDSLREDAVGLSLNWSISASTAVEAGARIEQVKTAHLPQNDFSGNTYDLALTWSDGAALKGRVALNRNIDAQESTYATYVLRQGGRLTGQWSIRPKWLARAHLSHEMLDYRGGSAASRADTLNDMSLALAYTPFRMTDLSFTYSQSKRDSSMALADFHDRTLQWEAKIRWD